MLKTSAFVFDEENNRLPRTESKQTLSWNAELFNSRAEMYG